MTLVLFILYGCQNNNSSQNNSGLIKNDEKVLDRLNNRILISNNRLIGKEIKFVENPTLSDGFTKNVLLVYNSFDCYSCLEKGYNILDKIKNESDQVNLYMIRLNKEIGENKMLNFDLNGINIIEDNDQLRNFLMETYTPVLITINKNNLITHVYHPITGVDDTQEVNNYINNTLQKL